MELDRSENSTNGPELHHSWKEARSASSNYLKYKPKNEGESEPSLIISITEIRDELPSPSDTFREDFEVRRRGSLSIKAPNSNKRNASLIPVLPGPLHQENQVHSPFRHELSTSKQGKHIAVDEVLLEIATQRGNISSRCNSLPRLSLSFAFIVKQR
jgi:hypothetical protein